MATNKIKSTWTGRGCLLVLAVTLTLGSQAATAQTETDDAVVLIVLDVSGSMGRAGADGTVLLDAAKEAVTELTASLPDDIDSGLRLYGHRTGQAESDKPEGCQDTELVVPVGQGSPDTVAAALQPLQPSGYTPIGTSLQQAAQDLGSASQATIVLVSDGEDSCQPPDPCEVAGELSEQGVDVVIDTVGLLLDTAEADSQLSCIAEATGGSFVTADDAASLGVALQEASSRAQRRYEVSGEPIEGAAVPFEAPDLQPGVQYVDEVRGDETLFYAIADLGPGDVFDVEIVREGVPDATGVFRVYTYLVDRDDNELGPDTCCTSQDLDTAGSPQCGDRRGRGSGVYPHRHGCKQRCGSGRPATSATSGGARRGHGALPLGHPNGVTNAGTDTDRNVPAISDVDPDPDPDANGDAEPLSHPNRFGFHKQSDRWGITGRCGPG